MKPKMMSWELKAWKVGLQAIYMLAIKVAESFAINTSQIWFVHHN